MRKIQGKNNRQITKKKLNNESNYSLPIKVGVGLYFVLFAEVLVNTIPMYNTGVTLVVNGGDFNIIIKIMRKIYIYR